jgi:hypothetical protein
MNFDELIRKYKDDTASDKEKEIVEKEIEKNKLINDYLVESLDDLFLYEDNTNIEINESVSNKLRKNIVYSVIIVILLYMLMGNVISPVIESMYYNPTEITQGEIMRDITFDMVALNELTVPGYEMLLSTVEKKGYGSYDLILTRKNTFGKNKVRIPISLTRNKREGFFDYLYSYDIEPKDTEKTRSTYDYEAPLSDLNSDNHYASVFITFNTPVTLSDTTTLERNFDNLVFQWVSVVHDNNDKSSKIGFQPISSITTSYGDKPNEEIYPLFFLHDYYRNNALGVMNKSYEAMMAECYEIHFRSLLNYLIERKEFIEVFDKNNLRLEFYKEAIEYIDGNGIQIEGMMIYGETKDLVDFIESNDVYGIQILDMKTSKYSKK